MSIDEPKTPYSYDMSHEKGPVSAEVLAQKIQSAAAQPPKATMSPEELKKMAEDEAGEKPLVGSVPGMPALPASSLPPPIRLARLEVLRTTNRQMPNSSLFAIRAAVSSPPTLRRPPPTKTRPLSPPTCVRFVGERTEVLLSYFPELCLCHKLVYNRRD
ncbi:hypothetical protein HPB48_015276 [Haemaphysalis longicornis]|uniref:Uncharacterized protein n=1 Tax=Haemaphysalis longicornis TaxID=44386 RepID=A0A9J6FTB1_HAELO|nr:hypothetical protein HPB48_015276 [Haemaphysalis longicornis]